MKREQIIRAWKDAAYRQSLSAEEQAMLPENPAGSVELSDAQLDLVTGAKGPYDSILCTAKSVCPCRTSDINKCLPPRVPKAPVVAA